MKKERKQELGTILLLSSPSHHNLFFLLFTHSLSLYVARALLLALCRFGSVCVVLLLMLLVGMRLRARTRTRSR